MQEKIIKYNNTLLTWNDGYIRTGNVADIPDSYPTDSLISRYGFDSSLNDTYGTNNAWDTDGSISWVYGTGLIDEDFKTNSTTTTATGKTIYNDTDSSVYAIPNETNFSISFWLKLTNASADYQKPMSFDNNLILGIGGASYTPPGSIAGGPFLYYGAGVLGYYASDFRDSAWHLYQIIDDGTNIKLYIDTAERISAASPSYATSTNVGFMGDIGGTTWSTNGELDLLYFYSKALDATERSTLYNSGEGV